MSLQKFKSYHKWSSNTEDSKEMSKFSHSAFDSVKYGFNQVFIILDLEIYCETEISFVGYEEFDL